MTLYLNQTAPLKTYARTATGEIALDKYGKPIVATESVIKCRKEMDTVKMSNGYGYVTVTQTVYYIDESVDVKNNDYIDNQLVISVDNMVDGFGKLIGYEVRV